MRIDAFSLSQIASSDQAFASRRVGRTALVLWVVAVVASPPTRAAGGGPAWQAMKCVRYGSAWTQALAHGGTKGLGAGFLARHRAFLKSGCLGRHDVCPRSPEEFKLANDMVVLAMNAGTASTFPPFGCPR